MMPFAEEHKDSCTALMMVPIPWLSLGSAKNRLQRQRHLSNHWYIPNTFSQLLVVKTSDFLSWRHIVLLFNCLKYIFLSELVQRGCCKRFDPTKCWFLKNFEGSIENGCFFAKEGLVGPVCAAGWEVTVPPPGWYSPGVVMSSLALSLLFGSDTQGNTKLITTTIYYLKLNKKAIMVPDCH